MLIIKYSSNRRKVIKLCGKYLLKISERWENCTMIFLHVFN